MPGMDERRAGADGDEQRVGRVAELLAAERGLHLLDGRVDLRDGRLGDLLALLVVGGADFGGDGEARRDGDADLAHLGEVGPLAAEQFLLLAVAVGRLAAEGIDVLRTHFRPS